MNRNQLNQVMGYLDAEYGAIVSRMSPDERKIRAQHWASEVGPLDFDSVMTAVRKLAGGQYMPRTAEVIAAVKEMGQGKRGRRMSCRIWQAGNDEVFDLRYSDGSEAMTGLMSALPEWMQVQFRWLADPTPENTARWDALIAAHS